MLDSVEKAISIFSDRGVQTSNHTGVHFAVYVHMRICTEYTECGVIST